MKENKSSISKGQTYEEIGEFWDTHDLDEYWDQTESAEFVVDIKSGKAQPSKSGRSQPLEVFYSYSHKDEELRDQLENHLSMLKREGVISGWHDRGVSAGQEWGGQIDEHLNSADIILLLVSADFLASNYCYDIEVKRAIERHEAGRARVVPIILRPSDWQRAPFGRVQALPQDTKPVTRWSDRDEAFLDIAKGIRRVAQEISEQGSARKEEPAALGNFDPHLLIPDLRVNFVARKDNSGRDIVKLLQDELTPQRPRLVALWGAGGVGKTAIAAEAVRGLIEPFGKRIAWVSADGRENFTLTTLLDDIATQLNHADLRKLSPELKKERVRDLIRTAPTLVVLDNFETIEPAEGTRCVDWLGKPASCSALVTTRYVIEGARDIPIEVMRPEEANDLLDQLIAQAHDARAFANIDRDRLIQTAEANPLVLQWIVGQIDLAQDPEEVLDDLRHGEGTAAERVFNRSFDLKQLNNGGRVVLLALSLFAPSATRKAVAEVCGLGKDNDRKKFKEAVRSLAALWLIHTTEESKRLAVEGLTRELTKARLDSDPRAVPFRKRFVSRFLRYATTNSQTTAEHLSSLEDEKENLLLAVDLACDIGDLENVAKITLLIYPFLSLRGYWDEAIHRGQKALSAAERSKDDYYIGVFADALSAIFENRGQYSEAMDYLRRSREIAERLNAKQGLQATLGKMAKIEIQTGNRDEARRLFNIALEINRKLDNKEGISGDLHGLASIEHYEGNNEEARRLQKEDSEVIRTLSDDNSVASSLGLLGLLEYEQGNVNEAEQLFMNSLAISERLGDQMSISAFKGCLATIAEDRGDIARARRLCAEILELDTKLGDQSGVADSLRRSGRLEREEGNFSRARDLYAESLEMERSLHRPSGQAMTLFLMGELCFDQMAYQEAEILLVESLDMFRTLKEAAGIAENLRVLGDVKVAQRSFSEAHSLYNDAFRIVQNAGNKFLLAKLLHSQALLAKKENDPEQAAALLRESLRLFEKVQSPKVQDVRLDLEQLGEPNPQVGQE